MDKSVTLANYYEFVSASANNAIPVAFVIPKAKLAGSTKYIKALNPIIINFGTKYGIQFLDKIDRLTKNYESYIKGKMEDDKILRAKIQQVITTVPDTYMATVVKDVADLIVARLKNSLFIP